MPLAEIVLRGSDGEQHQQDEAGGAEGPHAVSEEEPPGLQEFVLHYSAPFQGKTHDHPGPRKNVPIAVRTTSSNRNQVMIQNESGLRTSQRRKPVAVCGSVCAAMYMSAAMMSVGTSAT